MASTAFDIALSEGTIGGKRKETGWVSSRSALPDLERVLAQLRSEGKQTFVDWGAGAGFPCALAAHYGFDVTAYERDKELADRMLALFDRFGLSAHIVRGSYYPKTFQSIPLVDQEREVSRMRASLQGESTQAYFPEVNSAIAFHSQDVVYCYPWEIQIPDVLQLFSEYTRDDAVLVSWINVMQFDLLHQRFGLTVKPEGILSVVTKNGLVSEDGNVVQ